MHTVRYCLPVIKETKEQVLNQIAKNPDYDFYEIWLSYIADLDTDFVWKISNQYSGKLVFLFRKQNLEKSDLDKKLKEKIIKLLETSENFLDLDIFDQKEELNFLQKYKLKNKTIVSYHNYQETPEMEQIVKQIETFDPAIIKISTFCKEKEDSIKLLALLLKLKKSGKRFIILGMGEEGKIVRIYGALWGNEMNFAPASESEKSAPGQMTKKELEGFFERIKNGWK